MKNAWTEKTLEFEFCVLSTNAKKSWKAITQRRKIEPPQRIFTPAKFTAIAWF